MNVTVQVDIDDALAYLGGALERIAAACAAGLAAGAGETAIEQRTGTLGSAVTSWQADQDPLERLIGVPEESPAAKYAYLLGADDVTIRPQGHKYLAIPIGENVTPAGVGGRLYGSPREIPADLVAWVGRTVGVRDAAGDYDPLFALVEEVTIFGRDVLEPTVSGRAIAMRDRIAEEIAAVLRGGS